MAGLIWIASYPKSGNTWVRLFFENLLAGSDTPVSINGPKRFSVGYHSRLWWDHALGESPRGWVGSADWARAGHRVQRHVAALAPGGVLAKTHGAHITYGGLPGYDPAVTAAAIYLVRNPLDVAVSYAGHRGETINDTIRHMEDEHRVISGSEQVPEVLTAWSSHVRGWTGHRHERLLAVRYEDLVAEPQTWFGRIAAHVGLPCDRTAIERAIAFSRFDRLAEQETAGGFDESIDGRPFFRRGTPGEWREVLKDRQARRIARVHGAVMAEFGYWDDAFGEPPKAVAGDRLAPFVAKAPLATPSPIEERVETAGFNMRL